MIFGYPKGTLLAITLIFCLILDVLPLPLAVNAYRPDWTLLVLIYWSIALPHRINVGSALLCGVVLDLLKGSLLGTHAIVFSIIIGIGVANYQVIRNMSLWIQSLMIMGLMIVNHALFFVVSYVFNQDIVFMAQYLKPALLGAILWPWVFHILRKYRRGFQIN